jgi:hypothetical protein
MSKTDHEVEAAIEDARNSFDLGEFLAKRSFAKEKVSVFTDEEAAVELGGEYPVYGFGGVVTGFERSGVMGRIYDLHDAKKAEQPYDEAELERLVTEAEALTARLEETALTVELRSIPEDVKNVATATAKRVLEITGKVPADQEDEFKRLEFAIVVARSILSITQPDGTKRTRFSYKDAEYLRDRLPIGEFPKIHTAVHKLSYKQALATRHTVGDVDFSSAGS